MALAPLGAQKKTGPMCWRSIPTAATCASSLRDSRNCSGLAVQPENATLWCAVNERDIMGDDLPPDYATSVKEGGFYGWPEYIGADHPRHKGERPDLYW